MSIASGYVLHLYCDNDVAHEHGYIYPNSKTDFRQFPMEYVADGPKSYSLARKAAKKAGWKFHRNGKHTCPACNKTANPHINK
jgi:hypothetical protein